MRDGGNSEFCVKTRMQYIITMASDLTNDIHFQHDLFHCRVVNLDVLRFMFQRKLYLVIVLCIFLFDCRDPMQCHCVKQERRTST